MADTEIECYYGDVDYCSNETWECESCNTIYCTEHNHATDRGHNVECAACERERLEGENNCG